MHFLHCVLLPVVIFWMATHYVMGSKEVDNVIEGKPPLRPFDKASSHPSEFLSCRLAKMVKLLTFAFSRRHSYESLTCDLNAAISIRRNRKINLVHKN